MLPPNYPVECERNARTRDGVDYVIRPIRPDDLEREYAFVRGLSEETLYNRLMYAVHEPADALLLPLVNIDYRRHMALTALMDDRIVGVARYAIDEDKRQHEFAVAVADEWQGHGIGRTLLEDLFAYARRGGLKRLAGTVLPGNERMLALARSLGLTVHMHGEDHALIEISRDFD